MSTKFGIVPQGTQVELDDDGNLISDPSELTPFAVRTGTGGYFMGPFADIEWAMRGEVSVYALDNSPQGIYTVDDLRKLIHNLP